jgi:epoxyqueuosine reductase
MAHSKSSITQRIKKLAYESGFNFCGIAKAERLEEEERNLEEWLARGYQGRMGYLENHFDLRLDPTKLVPGAKSVISLAYNYYPKSDLSGKGYKVAKYAYGRDYHKVIKKKLKALRGGIEEVVGAEINARLFVDSAPVMERQWAQKAGNGWIGKNGLLLNRSMGSFFFLAEIICDLELEPDGPIKDYCGTCTRCMDACPTDAFPEPNVLDASRCISYFTIELKDQIPEGYSDKFNEWIFGCDICQDVCPWNRFSKPHDEQDFEPKDFLQNSDKKGWQELTEEVFLKSFRGSPLKRPGFDRIKRNILYQEKNLPGGQVSK